MCRLVSHSSDGVVSFFRPIARSILHPRPAVLRKATHSPWCVRMRAMIIISSTWVTPNSTLLLSPCYTYGGLHCTKHLPDQLPYVLRLVKAISFSLYGMAEYIIATSYSCLSVTRKTSRLKVGIKERSSLFFFILIQQAQTASIHTSSTLSTRTHNFLTHPTPHTISTRSSQSSSTTS